MAKQEFQTEVSQLLQLIIHSLYSHPEIFLRELISNSSDALDKLRYLTLTDESFKNLPFDPRIDLEVDEANSTLTVADSGIGMNEEDLIAHLGTIARSGTKNFLTQLSGDATQRLQPHRPVRRRLLLRLHGRRPIEVVSRKAGEDSAWRWTSDGKTGFDIEPAERSSAGTTVTLHLNDEGKTVQPTAGASRRSSRSTPTTSPFPSSSPTTKASGTPRRKKSDITRTTEQVNAASALWRRSKSEITDDEYTELYKSISGDSADPLFWFHTRAEGSLDYTTLFFIPANAPLDMYQAEYKGGVKLYVKRVFILDDSKDLLPQYLRFVRGIIDSEDLPLNVSRELLQQNRVLASIRTACVKKILSELKGIADQRAGQVPHLHHAVQPPHQRGPVHRPQPTARPCSTSSASSPQRSRASPRSPTPRPAWRKTRKASTTSPAARNPSSAPRPCSRSTKRRASKSSSSTTTSTRSSSAPSRSTATSNSSPSTRPAPATTSSPTPNPNRQPS